MVKSFPQNQDNHARPVMSRDRVVAAFVVSGQDWPEAGLRPWKVSLPRAAAGHPKGRSAVKEPRSGWTRYPLGVLGGGFGAHQPHAASPNW